MKKIVIIGPFPPPIHGMAKNLKIVADQLETKSRIEKLDISPRSIKRSILYHSLKLSKVTYCAFKLVSMCFKKEVSAIYIPPDAGYGAWYTLLFDLIASFFKIPLFFHHRSFAYIKQKRKAFQLIVKYQPINTTHIFLCKKMVEKFEELYGVQQNKMIVSNAQHVHPIGPNDIKPYNGDQPIVLGHLSNLGFEKGIATVFNLCHKLIEKQVNFKLLLAGPCENTEIETYVYNQIKELGSYVDYIGYADHEKKESFYTSIDLFLFPTIYRNEAQPNVIFEANAYGSPVLSINTGCISTDVNCENGFVFSDQEAFVESAAGIILMFADKPEHLMRLKQSTLNKITSNSKEAERSFRKMINSILNTI